MLFFLLWGSNTHADESVTIGGAGFLLRSGFCMAVYKGDTQYAWCIVKYQHDAEHKISNEIAKFLVIRNAEVQAKDYCLSLTTNCELDKFVCAD